MHSKSPPEPPLKPDKTPLRPLGPPSNNFKFKYYIILMIFGKLKLKIYAFTTSDQDVKLPPENLVTPTEAALRVHLSKLLNMLH